VGVPVLVQHVSASSTRENPLASPFCYYFGLADPARAGNAIVVGFTFRGNPSAAVMDDRGDSYTVAAHYYDSREDRSVGIAAAFGVKANARAISLCFSSDPGGYVQPTATEFANVVGIDGSGSGNSGRGTAISGGRLHPAAPGDLVYQVAASLSLSQSRFIAGAQTDVGWNLLSADLLDGWAAQYAIDTSAIELTPQMTLGRSDGWISAAVLLKSGSTGEVPSGLRVVHLLHENVPYHPQAGGAYRPFPNPLALQFPCSGNLLVSMIGGGNDPQPATVVTDSGHNHWSQAGHTYVESDDTVQAFYADNASCSPDLSLSTLFVGGAGDYTVLLYDVAGAADEPLDTALGGGGDYRAPGAFTMPFVLQPAAAHEIVFAQIMWDYNTGVGLRDGLFDANRFSGENLNGPEPVDENNGWGHFLITSTRPVRFTWQVLQPDTNPIRFWAGMAVAFKGRD